MSVKEIIWGKKSPNSNFAAFERQNLARTHTIRMGSALSGNSIFTGCLA